MAFGLVCWKEFNRTFQWLPLSARVGERVLCMHGGIGHLTTLAEIRSIARPLESSTCSRAVASLLWSDPTIDDQILGLHANIPRGGGDGSLLQFGPDRVDQFCERNHIDIIIRYVVLLLVGQWWLLVVACLLSPRVLLCCCCCHMRENRARRREGDGGASVGRGGEGVW
jgi:Calcineurin-like phosphoesterase